MLCSQAASELALPWKKGISRGPQHLEVSRLAAEVASLTGESKTEAIRTALEERRSRLQPPEETKRRKERMLRFLRTKVWPKVPRKELGCRLTRGEEDEILGYGPEGV